MYVSARFRVNLSEAEYKKVVAYIRKRQKENPIWHASLNNCVSFIKDIAQFMKLKVPLSSMMYPEVFVKNLKAMNTGKEEATSLFPTLQWGIRE